MTYTDTDNKLWALFRTLLRDAQQPTARDDGAVYLDMAATLAVQRAIKILGINSLHASENQWTCQKCNAECPDRWKFCGNCGAPKVTDDEVAWKAYAEKRARLLQVLGHPGDTPDMDAAVRAYGDARCAAAEEAARLATERAEKNEGAARKLAELREMFCGCEKEGTVTRLNSLNLEKHNRFMDILKVSHV